MEGVTMFQGVDHVVIAVGDLEAAIQQYETIYGIPATDRGEPLGAGFRNAYFRFDSTFLVAMRVDSLAESVAQLRERGVRLLGDPGPGKPIETDLYPSCLRRRCAD